MPTRHGILGGSPRERFCAGSLAAPTVAGPLAMVRVAPDSVSLMSRNGGGRMVGRAAEPGLAPSMPDAELDAPVDDPVAPGGPVGEAAAAQAIGGRGGGPSRAAREEG